MSEMTRHVNFQKLKSGRSAWDEEIVPTARARRRRALGWGPGGRQGPPVRGSGAKPPEKFCILEPYLEHSWCGSTLSEFISEEKIDTWLCQFFSQSNMKVNKFWAAYYSIIINILLFNSFCSVFMGLPGPLSYVGYFCSPPICHHLTAVLVANDLLQAPAESR